MHRRAFVMLSLVGGLLAPRLAIAQDVAITNARIIVGNGQVIESGTIVVRGGKIASVSPGSASTQGLRVIDAKGMSAMPGFIADGIFRKTYNSSVKKGNVWATFSGEDSVRFNLVRPPDKSVNPFGCGGVIPC